MLLGMGSHGAAQTTSYLSNIRNLLSTSAPNTPTDQTLTFTLGQSIPPNGAIELMFNEGGFTIPALLNFSDVDVAFGPPGGPYTERPLSSAQTAGSDRIVVTSGTAGKVRVDLNTSVGIGAGNEVRIKIGHHATFGAFGDQRMVLGTTTKSYPVTIYTYDAADAELEYGRTMIAIVDRVGVGPVDTDDVTPPVILSAEPSGLLQVGTRAVQLWVVTDERSRCRWATSSISYVTMPYQFTSTSTSGLAFWNFGIYSGLEDDTDYEVYVSCRDFRDNTIDPPYLLEFTVGIEPGSASSTATSTGTGTGTGTSTATSSCVGPECTGSGTGSGTGASGSGSGSSPSGGDGSGSGSGSTGTGSGAGTKLPQASVRIDGYAYPGATVSILQDGALSRAIVAGSDARFAHTIDGLDRGSYSYGVFAVDTAGVRSATYATTMWLRSASLSTLSNIMLPPTLSVAATKVDPGVPIAVSGFSAPGALVTVWLRPRLAVVTTADVVATTTAAASGSYTLTLATDTLPQGTYELVAQGSIAEAGIESDKSARKTIGVGVDVGPSEGAGQGDLNGDGFVNLVDFSILLFNWNTANAVADINKDGIVSLPDFSIMLFYWTG